MFLMTQEKASPKMMSARGVPAAEPNDVLAHTHTHTQQIPRKTKSCDRKVEQETN